MRTVLGVIIGDLIFAGSAALFFYLLRIDPHAQASVGLMALSIAYGVAFALGAGYVAGLISQREDLVTGMILFLIIAVPALITSISRPGAGAIWSQLSALVLMAPAGLIGDWIRLNRLRKKSLQS